MIQSRKTNTTRLTIWSLWWPMVVLLVGCGTHVPALKPTLIEIPPDGEIGIGDGGLLLGEPCAPPCFLGIVPSESTYEDVESFINSQPYANLCTAFDARDIASGYGFDCGAYIIRFSSEDGSFDSLGFTPEETITLRDVFDKYGEPAEVEVVSIGTGEITTGMRLFYPEFSMAISTESALGDEIAVGPSTVIFNVGYYSDRRYQKTTRWTQPWLGYGEYIMK